MKRERVTDYRKSKPIFQGPLEDKSGKPVKAMILMIVYSPVPFATPLYIETLKQLYISSKKLGTFLFVAP
jgi:hypothetical protein